MSGRVDDDDATVREFRLHAVAEHAQGIGLVSRAASIVQHRVLDVWVGRTHAKSIRTHFGGKEKPLGLGWIGLNRFNCNRSNSEGRTAINRGARYNAQNSPRFPCLIPA